MMIAPGDAILTKFGAGVVVRCFRDDDSNNSSPAAGAGAPPTWAVVRLWRQPGRSIASCATATLRVDDESIVKKKLVAAPGMVVRATINTAVVDGSETADAAADGNKGGDADDGTIGEEKDDTQLCLIERYLPSKDVFLASSIIDDNSNDSGGGRDHSLARSLSVMSSNNNSSNSSDSATPPPSCQSTKKYYQLHPHQISSSSSSAKFYPILEDLMAKGESAWNMALEKSNNHSPEISNGVSNVASALTSAVTVTTNNNSNNKSNGGENDNNSNNSGSVVAKLLSETSKSSVDTLTEKLATSTTLEGKEIDTAAVANMTAKQAITTATAKASAVSSAATEGISLPTQTEEIKQIYTMLRDDDLTQLFRRGKERLKELVDVEIPTRTKMALGAMGIELEDDNNDQRSADIVEDGKRSLRGGMDKLRKEALASLDQILKMEVSDDGNVILQSTNNNDTSIQIDTKSILDPSLLPITTTSPTQAKQQAQEKFASMFDHLSRAATSDPQLLQIFSDISEKTKSWQEMTGVILQTKTASLFMEGGQRLKSRAVDVLNVAPGQLRDAFGSRGGANTNSNDDLTRAFTEGDVAMAQLKSMEMGDAIRQRLFSAIEVRSESSGGLDAIIAGSLTAMQRKGDSYTSNAASLLGQKGLENVSLSSAMGSAAGAISSSDGISEETVESVINNLQQSATSTMADTKETLIALLSRRSGYRDAVLLRLEQVFLDLESTLGQDMSAEQIAKLANGEGGSLALFQPVAMKAAKEIEIQLDAAEQKMKESKHWNPKADNVLGTVRQITRGELGLGDILDMAAGYLDDEEVVSKSGGLIVKAESLLDDFEAASARLGDVGSKSMTGEAAPAAGIIDAVAKAGITKDTVMKGVEGLDVNKILDNTQSAMTDEVARRELISSAGDTALDFLLKILPSMPVPPFDGVRDGLVYHLSNLSMAGFKVKKEDIYIEIAGIRAAAQKSDGNDSTAPQSQLPGGAVKASELLIIDIKNISATLDDAVWSFEQTYMPYLKGSGKANTSLWDGAIRLKFELRRRIAGMETDPITGNKCAKWEPVLCLNDRACSIGGVELTIQGEGRITWVANKLASWLKNPLRDYVVTVIINTLKNNSGWLIENINQNLSPYWDFVMRTANLELDQLPKLARHHVTKAEFEDEDEVELVWRERVPLGLNILTNDESGYLKIIDFPRGTQARKVAQSKQLDPDMFRGSTIVSVNGRRYGPDLQVDLFAALKDPARPKAILFKLADTEGIKRIEEIVDQGKGKSRTKSGQKATGSENESTDLFTIIDIHEIGNIGLKFVASHHNFALAVSDFLRDSNGQGLLPVEKTGKISLNDLLSHINGTLVLGEKGTGKQKALDLFEEIGAKRPLSLGFTKPYLYNIVLEKNSPENESIGGPSELVFTEVKATSNENKIVLKDFAPSEGAAETGGVFVGDNLVFINGMPVGAGCRLLDGSVPSPKLGDVIGMLKQHTPLALTFARAQANQTSAVKTYLTSSPLSLDVESAYTFSIAATDYSQLGCKFANGMNGTDIVVKGISGVDGPFQQQMKASNQPYIGCKLESVDGEAVPSYVNSQLIVNAMKRRWAANGRVELTFCNEMHRDALHKVKS
ncbi:hypothetical protein ACHAXR_011895 [Thalassiosira sp. AJA248-18]